LMLKALGCFRNAIRLNKRHYNAWYDSDFSLWLWKQETTFVET